MNANNRQQILVIATAVVVGILLCDRLIFSPLTALWKERSLRITRLQADIAEGKGLLQVERSIRGAWERIRTNSLPDDAAQAEALMQTAIDGWEKQSGMRIALRKFTPKPTDENYMTVECQLNANGTIENLTRLLYDVENESLPIRIEDISITARDTGGQQLSLTLRMSGLIIQEQE